MSTAPPDAVSEDTVAPPSFLSLLAWLLIVLGVIYMVALGGGGFFGLYSMTFRIVSVVALTAALAVWLVLAWRRPFWRPTSSLALALVLSLGALAIALLFSERPRLGADYLAYAVLLTGAYLLQQRLFAHSFFGPRLGSLAVLLGFALCIVYVIRSVSLWLDFWSLVGHLTVPPLRPGFEGLAFGHPGTFATVVVLLWLASVAHLGLSTTRARSVIGLLGALVAFVVVVAGARGVWVGIAAATAFVGLAWVLAPERRRLLTAHWRSRRVRMGLVGAGLALSAVALILLPAIARRLDAGGDDLRASFNASSLRMFQDDPLTGLGPGMWVVERIRYTTPAEPDYYIPHGHNLYLQTIAELGVVGATAGVVVFVALARLVWLGIRSNDALAQRLGWTSLFALVYLGVHQLVDFYANIAALGFLLALLIARLDALTPAEPPWNAAFRSVALSGLGGRVAVIALGIATILSAGWLLRSEAAALDGQQATDAANAGDWAGALTAAKRAAAADPHMPPYLFAQGLAAAHEGKLEEARDAIREAAEIDDFPTAWLDVAQLELELGNNQAARAALGRAMRLGFQNPQVAYGAMTIFEALGDREAAVSAASDALVVAPGLASDPAWSSEAGLQEIFEAALPVALERAAPTIGYRIAMEAGRSEDALRIAAELPAEDRASADAAVRAWFGEELAFAELHRLAAANPLHHAHVAICRRVATRSHESDWPFDWRADCSGTGPYEYPAVRTGRPVEGRATLPGPDATWHFQYVHRRLAPADEIVPTLPHLSSVFRSDLDGAALDAPLTSQQ